MSETQLITEEQARKIAGVSSKTLTRFAEAGYLKVEDKNGGERHFLFRELRDLFGLQDADCPAQEASVCAEAVVTIPAEPAAGQAPLEQPVLEKTRFVRPEPSNLTEPSKSQKVHRELRRLKALNTMQEKLLDEREAEIADLKEQRTWLRERVEKLEDKADRDQLLLLSETRMVSQLLQQAHKKSALRLALEWTGIIPPEPEQRGNTAPRPTIEVQSK